MLAQKRILDYEDLEARIELKDFFFKSYCTSFKILLENLMHNFSPVVWKIIEFLTWRSTDFDGTVGSFTLSRFEARLKKNVNFLDYASF